MRRKTRRGSVALTPSAEWLKKLGLDPQVVAQSPAEHDQQVALVQWADNTKHARIYEGVIGDYLFAVPNGGKRSKSSGARLKAEGLRAGIPDLILAYASRGYGALGIEMKRLGHSHTRKEQREWHQRLDDGGWLVVVCKGFEEAKAAVLRYLE